MRSGCLPLYSDVKDQNAIAFVIPSYNGGRLGRVVIYRYLFENMLVSYFCKGVNAGGLVPASRAKNG